MRRGLFTAVSVVAGFFFMWPVGWLFGAMSWPVFHSWGLVHGSFVIAWPVLSLLAFAVLETARKVLLGKSSHGAGGT
jgi:hypothetical protein